MPISGSNAAQKKDSKLPAQGEQLPTAGEKTAGEAEKDPQEFSQADIPGKDTEKVLDLEKGIEKQIEEEAAKQQAHEVGQVQQSLKEPASPSVTDPDPSNTASSGSKSELSGVSPQLPHEPLAMKPQAKKKLTIRLKKSAPPKQVVNNANEAPVQTKPNPEESTPDGSTQTKQQCDDHKQKKKGNSKSRIPKSSGKRRTKKVVVKKKIKEKLKPKKRAPKQSSEEGRKRTSMPSADSPEASSEEEDDDEGSVASDEESDSDEGDLSNKAEENSDDSTRLSDEEKNVAQNNSQSEAAPCGEIEKKLPEQQNTMTNIAATAATSGTGKSAFANAVVESMRGCLDLSRKSSIAATQRFVQLRKAIDGGNFRRLVGAGMIAPPMEDEEEDLHSDSSDSSQETFGPRSVKPNPPIQNQSVESSEPLTATAVAVASEPLPTPLTEVEGKQETDRVSISDLLPPKPNPDGSINTALIIKSMEEAKKSMELLPASTAASRKFEYFQACYDKNLDFYKEFLRNAQEQALKNDETKTAVENNDQAASKVTKRRGQQVPFNKQHVLSAENSLPSIAAVSLGGRSSPSSQITLQVSKHISGQLRSKTNSPKMSNGQPPNLGHPSRPRPRAPPKSPKIVTTPRQRLQPEQIYVRSQRELEEEDQRKKLQTQRQELLQKYHMLVLEQQKQQVAGAVLESEEVEPENEGGAAANGPDYWNNQLHDAYNVSQPPSPKDWNLTRTSKQQQETAELDPHTDQYGEHLQYQQLQHYQNSLQYQQYQPSHSHAVQLMPLPLLSPLNGYPVSPYDYSSAAKSSPIMAEHPSLRLQNLHHDQYQPTQVGKLAPYPPVRPVETFMHPQEALPSHAPNYLQAGLQHPLNPIAPFSARAPHNSDRATDNHPRPQSARQARLVQSKQPPASKSNAAFQAFPPYTSKPDYQNELHSLVPSSPLRSDRGSWTSRSRTHTPRDVGRVGFFPMLFQSTNKNQRATSPRSSHAPSNSTPGYYQNPFI